MFWRALATLGLVTVLAGAALAGCFSEHSATTAVAEGTCSFPLGPDVPGSTIVVIQDFTFQPADVQVQAGGRVTWVNCDTDNHTSTADGGEWSFTPARPGRPLHRDIPHRRRIPLPLSAPSVHDWTGTRHVGENLS